MTELFGMDLGKHFLRGRRAMDHKGNIEFDNAYQDNISHEFGYNRNMYRLQWDKFAPRRRKYTQPYDKNIPRIKKAGMQRPPKASEVISLIYAYLEENLSSRLGEVAEDIFAIGNEYVCCGMQRLPGGLLLYDGFDASCMTTVDIVESSTKLFTIDNIDDIASGGWIDMKNEASSELVKYLFMRKFDAIPELITDNYKQIGLSLPDDNQFHMLGISITDDFFGFKPYDESVSRGVRYG